jgi:hypothetical protein
MSALFVFIICYSEFLDYSIFHFRNLIKTAHSPNDSHRPFSIFRSARYEPHCLRPQLAATARIRERDQPRSLRGASEAGGKREKMRFSKRNVFFTALLRFGDDASPLF